MIRLGVLGGASGTSVARGLAILTTTAVRDSDPDRRVDAIIALKRVMLDTRAESFNMTVNLTAGFLLCWLLAEDPDERIRLSASWALEGIPYRNAHERLELSSSRAWSRPLSDQPVQGRPSSHGSRPTTARP